MDIITHHQRISPRYNRVTYFSVLVFEKIFERIGTPPDMSYNTTSSLERAQETRQTSGAWVFGLAGQLLCVSHVSDSFYHE